MSENAEEGGYDVEFVDNEPNDVICSICLFVLREPMQAEQCGHRFCKSCIEKLMNRENNTIDCPKDRNTVKVFKDHGKEREILNTLVKCSNNKYGCTFTKELRDLENHLEVCELQTITCPIQGCQDQVQRKFLDSHTKHKHYEDKYTLLEKKLEQVLQEIQAKSLKMEDLNCKIAAQDQKIASQADEITALKQSVNVLEGKPTNQLFYHSYIWKIHNFRKKFERAQEDMVYQPQVRRFYTSQGYKIKAEVYLNGDEQDDWGEWLTVYIGLEPGRFDEILKWPMAAKISTSVCGDEDAVDFGTRDKDLRQDFQKPKDDYNGNDDYNGYGFTLISVDKIGDYVDGNTLTLIIDVSHY